MTTTILYEYPLTCEDLMGRENCVFPCPINAQSGAFNLEDDLPNIDPSLLVHFTTASDDCTWVRGLDYVECAGVK